MTDNMLTPDSSVPTPPADVAPPAITETTPVSEAPPAADTPATEPDVPTEPETVQTQESAEADDGEQSADVEAQATSAVVAEPESNKRWYVVKVQSGREDSIKEAIERRVKIEGLEEFFGQIVIPVEHVTEMRNNKRVHKYRKLYPGYLMCEVEYNDRILYLFRETSGVGDFVGGSVNRPPPPMSQREIDRMIHQKKDDKAKTGEAAAPPKPKFDRGDHVRVRDGIFSGMEGEVKDILEQKGQVRVELTIFGRPTAVELEYWQVEPL